MMKQIYKNLYYNEEDGAYYFVNGTDQRQVVNQESYLLTYILEVLLKNGKT